jgi:hypothetical protein
MFDNITLRIYDFSNNYILSKDVKYLIRRDKNIWSGKIKNIKIRQNYNCLTIHGSLAKYLNDENITPLNREGVKQAIEKLEQDIGINLENAVVCSVEFGTSIIVKESPFEYMLLFGYTNRLYRHVIANGNKNKLIRHDVSRFKGIETVFYTTPTGSFEFIVYDKIKEMLAKKICIPSFFIKKNVIRLEYKIRKRRGIEAKFKDGLTAYCLFDKNVYNRFQKLFLNKYKEIGKMGRLVNGSKLEEITPAKLKKIMAEHFRQRHPDEYNHCLQRFLEAGKITPKNIEIIRAENNKLGNDIYVSEQSPLIMELDTLVSDRAMFGN